MSDPSRDALHQLGIRHALSPSQHRALLGLAEPQLDGPGLPRVLTRTVALLAALLLGLALVMAVASQWGEWGRAARFALLQGALGVAALATLMLPPPGRAAAGLLMLIAQGGLLAFFGQTYQTGADPWQLFALWALLGLPLVLALRHDAPWALWSLVASVAVVLAVQTFGGRSWLPPVGQRQPLLAGAAALLALGLLFAARPAWLGVGRWAARAQMLWSCAALAGWALFAAWAEAAWGVYALLGLLLAGALAALWRGGDALLLALVAAALDAWLLAGWARWVFSGRHDIGQFLVFALGAALLLAGTVSLLMRRLRTGSAS